MIGQKVWTSGAHVSDIGLALCRSSSGQRHRNLTALVIDMHTPGVEVRPLRQMTGGAAFNEVFLDDVRVPDDHRLGVVGGGWIVALSALAHERSSLGGSGFGGKGVLSLQRIAALARQAGADGDPVVRQSLATLVCGLRSAAWLRQRIATNGSAHGPLVKLALCRDLERLSSMVSMLLGPKLVVDTGEWGTFAWTGFVLGVPGYRIGGGTDEVLKSLVAERLLGLPREPA